MRGYTQSKDDYLRRLRRIEDEVRGLVQMVEEDKYCIDILTKVSAANEALQSVAIGLLSEHIRRCVHDAALKSKTGNADEMVTEATKAIARLVKS